MMADEQHFQDVASTVRDLLRHLRTEAPLRPGDVFVLGASTSEIIGQHIGTATSLALGRLVVQTVLETAGQEFGCHVVFQCCEHLNRALVVERHLARERGWQEVRAIPVPGAGGAVAAAAYERLEDPCLVEAVLADAGMDIGDTLIGMHLRRVAVPVRGHTDAVGEAHVVMAKTRPPLIGGTRAVYDEAEAKRRWNV